MIRTKAYILRFWQRIWYQGAHTQDEIMADERCIIASVQLEEYFEDYHTLERNGRPEKGIRLKTYSLSLFDEVIRMKGRLESDP